MLYGKISILAFKSLKNASDLEELLAVRVGFCAAVASCSGTCWNQKRVCLSGCATGISNFFYRRSRGRTALMFALAAAGVYTPPAQAQQKHPTWRGSKSPSRRYAKDKYGQPKGMPVHCWVTQTKADKKQILASSTQTGLGRSGAQRRRWRWRLTSPTNQPVDEYLKQTADRLRSGWNRRFTYFPFCSGIR